MANTVRGLVVVDDVPVAVQVTMAGAVNPELHPTRTGITFTSAISTRGVVKGSSPLLAFCQCFFNPPNSADQLLLFGHSLLHQ